MKDYPEKSEILALIGPDGILPVKAVPGARVERAAVENGALKIWLRTPPEDGKANKALLKIIARMLDLPAGDLELVSGATGREKRVRKVR